MIEHDDTPHSTEIAERIAGLTQVATVAPDEATRILEARARVLARKPSAAPAEHLEVVRFARGAETFLIESRRVLAVTSVPRITRLPRTRPPTFGLGVFRGDLLVLAELRPDAQRASGAVRVLVLGDDEPVVGLLVDSVAGVEHIPLARLHAPTGTEDAIVHAVTDDAAALIATDVLLAHFARSHS